MELLLLLVLNLCIGVGLYYGISAKTNARVHRFMTEKLDKEMDGFVLEVLKETDSHIAVLQSKITAYRNLIQKAESTIGELQKQISKAESIESTKDFVPAKVNTNFEEDSSEENTLNEWKEEDWSPLERGVSQIYGENQNGSLSSKRPEFEFPQAKKPVSQKKPVVKKPDDAQELNRQPIGAGSAISFFSVLGKGVRKFFGIDEIVTANLEITPPLVSRVRSVDYSVDGDPFAEDNDPSQIQIRDRNQSGESFMSALNDATGHSTKQKPDSITISAKTALQELGDDATKIDKVVFLLKRKYSHEDISDVLDISVGEVSIIETFRLERNRRV